MGTGGGQERTLGRSRRQDRRFGSGTYRCGRLLAELRDQLRSRSFRPLPVRERMIPKPGSRKRRRLGHGGALDRDPLWREMLGPAGLGDQLGAPLAADGVCWASLALYRDDGRAWFSPGDVAFVASVAPLLAARLRAGLRHTTPAGTDPGEPGTIIVDRDQKLITATSHAWRWIARLGLEKPATQSRCPASSTPCSLAWPTPQSRTRRPRSASRPPTAAGCWCARHR